MFWVSLMRSTMAPMADWASRSTTSVGDEQPTTIPAGEPVIAGKYAVTMRR